MAVTQTHTLYGIEVGNSNVLGGIVAQDMPLGTDVRAEASSGEVYARHQSLVVQKPTLSFSSRAIAAALGFVGISGKNIATLTGGLSLYGQKTAAGGTRAGGANHFKYNMTAGLIAPTTLSVEHGGDAVLAHNVMSAYDGTNAPITGADSQALPAGIADDERWAIGKVTLESIALTQVRSIEIDFGLDVVSEGSDGEIYDRYVWIRSINPVITLRGIDINWLDASRIPLLGLNATHANTTIFLRKRADGGTFVADATLDHIKFTAAGLVIIENAHAADGSDAAETTAVLQCKYDGTNAPITFTDNVAIP